MEEELYDHVLRNSTYTSPSNLYVALHDGDPTDAGTSNEISGNGYSRQSVTFGAPTDGSGTNNGAVTFTASGGNWGTITYFSIWDASTSGNCLLYSALDNSRNIFDGDSLSFAVGSITAAFA